MKNDLKTRLLALPVEGEDDFVAQAHAKWLLQCVKEPVSPSASPTTPPKEENPFCGPCFTTSEMSYEMRQFLAVNGIS